MLKHPTIRLSLIVLLIFSGVALAYKQMNMFEMMGVGSNSITAIKAEMKSESGSEKSFGGDEDADYFSIFKLITSLVPGKKAN